MLVKQLQEIAALDSEIHQRHQELTSLYQMRAQLVDPHETAGASTAPFPAGDLSGTSQEYARLRSAWQFYDITIPAYKILQKRLQRAEATLDELYAELPNLRGRFNVVLVPPTKLIGFPVKSVLRERQDFIIGSDYLNPALKSEVASQSWKVLLVYKEDAGMYLGDPQTVLADKSYLLAGFDMRALGMHEYAAFSLQERHSFDTDTWTMLLKGKRKGQVIPIASRERGRFSFEFDESGSDFGDDRFRPALEIK